MNAASGRPKSWQPVCLVFFVSLRTIIRYNARTIYSLGLIDGLRIRAFRSSLLAVMGQENNVKKVREARMLSKAELARLAGISPLTLDRIEKGKECRLATKRKILLALGLTIEQKNMLF